MLFLETREHDRLNATLLSSAGGMIQAWSVHGGGLLAQFQAAHTPGESVPAMATDKQNCILITGDSLGYIKVSKP